VHIPHFPRPWADALYRKMTKAQREKLKRRLLRKGGPLVKTWTSKDGRKRVSMSQQLIARKIKSIKYFDRPILIILGVLVYIYFIYHGYLHT